MTVRTEDGREWTGRIFGSVNIPRHEKPGQAFEIDFFNGVITAVDCAVDNWVEWRSLWKWPEPKADEEVFAKRDAALLPFLLSGGRREWKVIVQRPLGRLSELWRGWLSWFLSKDPCDEDD